QQLRAWEVHHADAVGKGSRPQSSPNCSCGERQRRMVTVGDRCVNRCELHGRSMSGKADAAPHLERTPFHFPDFPVPPWKSLTAPILTCMRLGWPLTGRSKEMRLIEAALSDRECSGMVVCGAAGVGKSRIAREATTLAASNGYAVRWVVATSPARALPLGAL